jgi:hypothetical protein
MHFKYLWGWVDQKIKQGQRQLLYRSDGGNGAAAEFAAQKPHRGDRLDDSDNFK